MIKHSFEFKKYKFKHIFWKGNRFIDCFVKEMITIENSFVILIEFIFYLHNMINDVLGKTAEK